MPHQHAVATSPKPWTNQAYFDEAVRYLSTMPHRATDGGNCLYRDPDGLACVVGHFIPNDSDVALNPENFLRHGVDELDQSHPELDGVAWPSGGVGRDLAMLLQGAHDAAYNWGDGGFTNYERLYVIAERCHLDTTVLDQIEAAKEAP